MADSPLIPEGSSLQRLTDGNILITYPGAPVPSLCVQPDERVRTAITRLPVTSDMANAARRYVRRHQA